MTTLALLLIAVTYPASEPVGPASEPTVKLGAGSTAEWISNAPNEFAPAQPAATPAPPQPGLAAPGPVEQVRYGEPTPLPAASPPSSQAVAPLASSAGGGFAPAGAASKGPAPSGQRPFDQRLTALELALSSIVVERPTLWRFERLDAEAADLMGAAENEQDRAAVRSVGDRIDDFRRLAGRLRDQRAQVAEWRAPKRPQQDDQAVDRSAEAGRIAPPVRLTKASPASGQHDVEGVLRPVVSKRPDAPKYAVIDEDGKIAALVTPTPEVDARLKSLVGKRVGLEGQRGYLTDLRRDHVVAERVTPLGTVRR